MLYFKPLNGTIRFRLIDRFDVDYLYGLRINNNLNRHLSSAPESAAQQEQWMRGYKLREFDRTEFYFVIERLDGVKCGAVRLYDFKENSFCWGSWILDDNKTRYSSIESAFMVYLFGFECLKFTASHFDVRKENEKVISFHLKFGAKIVNEDNENYYFEYQKEDFFKYFSAVKEKFKL